MPWRPRSFIAAAWLLHAYMQWPSIHSSCIFIHNYSVYTILYAFSTVIFDTIMHNYSQNTAFENTSGGCCAQNVRTQCTTQQDRFGGFRCAVGCARVGMHAQARSVLPVYCLFGAYLWSIWILSEVLHHLFHCLCDRMRCSVCLSVLLHDLPVIVFSLFFLPCLQPL